MPRDVTRNELWNNLSLTGNWGNRQLDSNGDGDFTDEEDRDEPSAYNTFNKANEWTFRRVQKAATDDRDEWTYTYDAAGQLTKMELDRYRGVVTSEAERTLVYDAFGRLVRVEGFPTESGPLSIAAYRYNGLGYRIGL